jgi:hypothetical protein
MARRQPVHLPWETEVHEHERGTVQLHVGGGFLGGRGTREDCVAQMRELPLEVLGHDGVVFYDEHCGHG